MPNFKQTALYTRHSLGGSTSLSSAVLDPRLGHTMNHSPPVVKLWGNAGEQRSLPFLAGERRSPSLHDLCGGTRGTWRTPRPLHHQLKSKYGHFFAQ